MSHRLINKIEWKYWHMIFQAYQRFKGTDHNANIIVFGSGRSGTTHLASVIAKGEGFKLIDEPLKNASSYKIDQIGLTGWGQYIPENEKQWIEANNFFDRVLAGKEFNPNHIPDKSNLYQTKTWVLKFIRANLLMPWIIQNFSVRTPVYILRNPYAVVASRLNHVGWGKNKPLVLEKKIQMPKFRYYDQFYQKYEKFYHEATRLEELLTLGWVLENQYVLNHSMHNKNWLSISYEQLVLAPIATLEKIGEALQFDVTESMTTALNKPSRSTTKEAFDPDALINGWKKVLTEEQVEIIAKTLEKTGMADVYNDTVPYPNSKYIGNHGNYKEVNSC